MEYKETAKFEQELIKQNKPARLFSTHGESYLRRYLRFVDQYRAEQKRYEERSLGLRLPTFPGIK